MTIRDSQRYKSNYWCDLFPIATRLLDGKIIFRKEDGVFQQNKIARHKNGNLISNLGKLFADLFP